MRRYAWLVTLLAGCVLPKVPEPVKPETVHYSLPARPTVIDVALVIEGDLFKEEELKVQFSEPMKANSALFAVKVFHPARGEPLDARTYYLTESNAIYLAPLKPFEEGVEYRLVVTTEAEDIGGDRLSPRYTATFIGGTGTRP